MERPQLEVVIVAYGAADFLEHCLRSLGRDWPCHVVDNSADSEVKACAERHGCTYTPRPENAGFAAGVNRGFRECAADADILILNPDAMIAPGAVESLRGALEADPGLAAVAPTLLRPDGSQEPTAWPMPTPGLPWRGVVGRAARSRETFLSGAVLMIAGQARAEVGDFDERYFLYSEETDWQRRARDQGWRLEHVPEATARHVGGGTSTDSTLRELYFHSSAETYLRKWYGARGWQVGRLGSLLAATRRSVTSTGVERSQARRTALLYLEGPQRALRRQRANAT